MSIKFVGNQPLTRNIVVVDDGSLCLKVYGPAEKKDGWGFVILNTNQEQEMLAVRCKM